MTAGRKRIHYITSNGVGNAWVANELRVLKQRGIPFTLHALRRAEQNFFSSPDAIAMDEGTVEIYPIAPWSFLATLVVAPFMFGGRYFAGIWNGLTGPRESLPARLRALAHFFVGAHWARKHRHEDVAHIHAQWVHSCGSVAMAAARLLDVSWSFTGHAADLFRERVALKDKIRSAEFLVCISSFHRDFFLSEGARPEQLVTVYCGIDVSLFAFREAEPPEAAGHIVSSGRLVPKKGFPVLIEACAELQRRGVSFRCTIAGSGPDEALLRGHIADAGVEALVTLTGEPLLQEDIPAFMADGSIYCLPCVEAADGDIDGLPQMLMEAMACGLPAVSTQLVGIPDLIDESCGILVPAEDVKALADALEALLASPERRASMSRAARRVVEDRFSLPDAVEPLVERFRGKLGA